jgi:hypothetical protein
MGIMKELYTLQHLGKSISHILAEERAKHNEIIKVKVIDSSTVFNYEYPAETEIIEEV